MDNKSVRMTDVYEPASSTEALQMLTTLIETNLTTVRLLSVMVQNNHFTPTFILFVPLPQPIRASIPSWTHFSVLGKVQGMSGLIEATQSNLKDHKLILHSPEEPDEHNQSDKENRPDQVNRNAQRQLLVPTNGKRFTRPNVPCSPTRRSNKLQVIKSAKGDLLASPHCLLTQVIRMMHWTPYKFTPSWISEG
jgi:hypothetical protein